MDTWKEKRLRNKIPMVFGKYSNKPNAFEQNLNNLWCTGATAHSDATKGAFDMLKWNDSDAFSARVEAKLGGFNISLPNKTLELYNTESGGDNYIAYASMVSDIRTVCPLQELANMASR